MNVTTHRMRNHRTVSGTLRACATLLACAFLLVCVQINKPSNGAVLPAGPVLAEVGFRSPECGPFQATLDKTNITGLFNWVPPANAVLQATLTNLAAGTHSLSVSDGTLQWWFLIPYCGSGSDSVAFTIQGPSFSLSATPDPLVVTKGSANTLTIKVARAGGFTGPVTVTVTGLPNSVTATPSTLTIPGGSTSATTTIAAASTALVGPSNPTLAGSAQTLNAQITFTLKVVAPVPVPMISAVNPTSQSRGGAVVVSGTNFDPVCANNSVAVGGASTNPTNCSATSLTFAVPSSTTFGNTTVQVITNGLQSNAVPFTILPTEVVAAAGPNNTSFAVIDFTNPSTPNIVTPNPGYLGGSVVDCSGSKAAVGNQNGGQVVLYDLSNPANPTKLGTISTVLGGIGAIKVDGTRVLVGEMNGVRAVLIDASNPNSLSILSTLNTGVSSIASISLSGSHAIASGPNNMTMDIIDYTNPSSPTRASFNPGLASALTVDLDGTLAAVGAQNSSQAELVDIIGLKVASGPLNTQLAGIFSISVKGSKVAAGSSNNFIIALMDFTNRLSPSVSTFNPGFGGGWSVVRTSGRLAAGNITGLNVALFDISGTTPALLANVNSKISSIGTICISDF